MHLKVKVVHCTNTRNNSLLNYRFFRRPGAYCYLRGIVVYLEYQSVCPIVRIGSPLPQVSVSPPLDPKGGQQSLVGEGCGDPIRKTR
jgi:hypothetical protein